MARKLRRSPLPITAANLPPSDRVETEIASVGSIWLRASFVLALCILLFGIITALSTASIVYRTFSPIIDWDQWTTVYELAHHNGHFTLGWLWAQHNEHRIPIGKLLCYADLQFFGGRNISLLYEIYLIQALEALFLTWIFCRFGSATRDAILTAAGFFLFCMFDPIQMENFSSGFAITFVLLPFFVCLSIGAIILYAERVSREGSPKLICWQLFAALVCGLAAESSLASGIFIWPVLVGLSLKLRMPSKARYLIGLVGACAVAIYLWGYHSPDPSATPVNSLRHPLDVINYVRAYLGWSWDPAVPSRVLWPTLAQWCAMAAIVVVTVAVLKLMFSDTKPSNLDVFLLANMTFVVITSLVTALGRINFGLEQAASSRYQTIALGFWGSFAAFILWKRVRERTPAAMVEVQLGLLLLMLASVPRFTTSSVAAQDRQQRLARAYGQYIEDPASPQSLAVIGQSVSPFPGFPDAYNYLLAHHIGPDIVTFRPIQGILSPLSPSAKASFSIRGFQLVSPDVCLGALDTVARIPGSSRLVTVQGWAWNLRSGKAPSLVVLAVQNGTVIGSSPVSLPRLDVQSKVGPVRDLRTGWMVETSLAPGQSLRAFVISDDMKSACSLDGEFTRQGS